MRMSNDFMIRSCEVDDRGLIEDCLRYLPQVELEMEPDEKVAEGIIDAYWERLWRSVEENEGRWLVATVDERIVGFVCGWVEREPDEEHLLVKEWWYVADLVVLPEFQKRGIACELMVHMEVEAKSRGLLRIQVGALWRNDRARAFYEKCGYREFVVTYVKKV